MDKNTGDQSSYVIYHELVTRKFKWKSVFRKQKQKSFLIHQNNQYIPYEIMTCLKPFHFCKRSRRRMLIYFMITEPQNICTNLPMIQFFLQNLILLIWIVFKPSMISIHMTIKVCDEITCLFTNFSCCTVHHWIWVWIGFIVITYTCMDLSQSMLVKGAQQRNYILFRTVTFRRGDAI